jgi:hypothetical protein
MTTHCETCQCDDLGALTTFNVRCRRLITSGAVALRNPISSALAARMSTSPRFALGFREFLPAAYNDRLAGLFLCSITPLAGEPLDDLRRARHRYFAVVIPSPMHGDLRSVPKPFEYDAGGEFDIGESPRAEELEEIARWSDHLVARWLGLSLNALHDFVEARIA